MVNILQSQVTIVILQSKYIPISLLITKRLVVFFNFFYMGSICLSESLYIFLSYKMNIIL